ncbi:hypothetical protein Taro_004900 [Colocasia esculenta]|uniref:Uncharacterized protein n=1 Tax=Colocasia esculenta TaxID=4460 RepID=A0A843TW96_COLES|nr:hypothetical protein [Colocasia esculenta]
MSPSQFQRVKCPSREHKPQFGLLSEKTLLLRRTGAWELRGAWEEPSWLSCKVGDVVFVFSFTLVFSLPHCSSSLSWHAWMLFKGEEVLGSWEEARGSSELGGGGLLAYEKGPSGETSQQFPPRRSEETGPQ